MEYLEDLKNFSFNIKLEKYDDYVNYFYRLDLDTQIDIIATMIDYKKYNVNKIKNGNLDKLYNAYNILLHKLEYNKLNIKERDIYENISSYLIIDNEFENNKLFKMYCNKYLNNLNSHNFNRRLFLIMQDVLNILNEYYNENIKFLLTNSIRFAGVNWLDIKYKYKILLNIDEFSDYFFSNNNNEKNILSKTLYFIYVVCHEYEHILQREYMYKNNNDLSITYKDDMYMFAIYNRFYEYYHDNFYIENEANEYGILNALEYIEKYFQKTKLYKEELKKDLIFKADINIKNNKEYLIQYKIYLLFIKVCQKFNVETLRMREIDNLYKKIKKRFNSLKN